MLTDIHLNKTCIPFRRWKTSLRFPVKSYSARRFRYCIYSTNFSNRRAVLSAIASKIAIEFDRVLHAPHFKQGLLLQTV